MILYNITFKDDKSDTLVPYVPHTAADEEDKQTRRICLSDSISNCICAIGPCNRDLHIGSSLIVRSVDTAKLSNEFLVQPKELYISGKVPDAMEYNEYWYLKEIKVSVHIAIVDGFEYYRDIAWTCIKVEDVCSIVRELGFPDWNCNISTAKELYNKALSYFHENKDYAREDEIWDRIAELPFAQRLCINNLKLHYVF